MNQLEQEVARRRTFAIISHPDAGKTTVTEKLLLLGGAINTAGNVKARKSQRYATSDWMAIEQARGISVTSSVMQFEYDSMVINLLDTPGHEDFSEDTYRTLTAVDSALMVIDAAKGVEDRTVKLLEICRLRNTPIITLINKIDRYARDPLELLDEIEKVLKIQCTPVTWPLGSGQHLGGIYHLLDKNIIPYARENSSSERVELVDAASDPRLTEHLTVLKEEIELIEGAGVEFDVQSYTRAQSTPVFFGSALHNFGIQELLDLFVRIAPAPQSRETDKGVVEPNHTSFSGFIFKIQANMDAKHRDRMAFMRVCSGRYTPGIKVRHVRLNREVPLANALTFMAKGREHIDEAWPGDIIGIHNHGTIQIGDTFTNGEPATFKGIPSFAPELFRRVRTADPLRSKALLKGLKELGEEGAAQVFRYLDRNDLILGAVGILQFDVVAWRLKHEYGVECIYEPVQVQLARWIVCTDDIELHRFKHKTSANLALDGGGQLTYLAPSQVNLQLTQERWPDVVFRATREIIT